MCELYNSVNACTVRLLWCRKCTRVCTSRPSAGIIMVVMYHMHISPAISMYTAIFLISQNEPAVYRVFAVVIKMYNASPRFNFQHWLSGLHCCQIRLWQYCIPCIEGAWSKWHRTTPSTYCYTEWTFFSEGL